MGGKRKQAQRKGSAPPNLVVPPLGARAQELVHAFFAWRTARFDLQIRLIDLEPAVDEEVFVMVNDGDQPSRLVPLSGRDSRLQVDWKASDESGRKLILLPMVEVLSAYEEICAAARAILLAQPDLPAQLRALLEEDNWKANCCTNHRLADLSGDEDEVDRWIAYYPKLTTHNLASSPALHGRIIALFFDYIFGRMFGHYRPWVLLNEPVKPSDDSFRGYAFVKYTTGTKYDVKAWEKLVHGFLGWVYVQNPIAYVVGASNHARFKAPDGHVFDRPIKRPQVSTRAVYDRSQMQFYMSTECADQWLEDSDEDDELEFAARLSQSPSIRAVTAALFLVVSLLPLGMAAFRGAQALPDQSVPALLAAITWANTMLVVHSVTTTDINTAAAVAFPLAVQLFGAAWTTPSIRGFLVCQLLLAVGFALVWLIAPVLSLTALSLQSIAVLLAMYNAVEMGMTLRGMPPETYTPTDT